MKAVLIRLDHLGDILLCTPLLRVCAKAGIAFDAVVPGSVAPILEGNPHIKQVISIDEICPGFPGGWKRLANWLKPRGYDALVLPYGQPKELLWASMMSGIPKRVAMWSGIWGRLTFHTCLRSHWVERPRHFAEIMLEMAPVLGAAPAGILPEVFLTDVERNRAADQFRGRFGNRIVVGIHPGCAGNTCNLPPAEYGRLAECLLENPAIALAVTGSPGEKELVRDWPDAIRQSDRVWNVIGELSLRELAGIISHMRLYVVPSTGPLHIAAALGVATLSPFCPSAPKCATVWGNSNGRGVVLEADPAVCRWEGNPAGKRCDFGGTVTGEMLAEKAGEILKSQG